MQQPFKGISKTIILYYPNDNLSCFNTKSKPFLKKLLNFFLGYNNFLFFLKIGVAHTRKWCYDRHINQTDCQDT